MFTINSTSLRRFLANQGLTVRVGVTIFCDMCEKRFPKYIFPTTYFRSVVITSDRMCFFLFDSLAHNRLGPGSRHGSWSSENDFENFRSESFVSQKAFHQVRTCSASCGSVVEAQRNLSRSVSMLFEMSCCVAYDHANRSVLPRLKFWAACGGWAGRQAGRRTGGRTDGETGLLADSLIRLL